MTLKKDIVVTGLGVVSPVGLGIEAFWTSLCEGRSGIKKLSFYDDPTLPLPFGGEILDFDPKAAVRPRKSLKVMSRDIQLAFAAADQACEQAGHQRQAFDPDRFGALFGADIIPCELDELAHPYRDCIEDGRFVYDRWGKAAMADLFPLWMLKYLPNMPACHVCIAQDARGPNNTLTLGEVSSLSAAVEAYRVIDRGQADVMVCGGVGSRIHPTLLFRYATMELSRRGDDPAKASRPFDVRRDGMVNGEGAAAMVAESREHAESRGAEIFARISGCAMGYEPAFGEKPLTGSAIRNVLRGALKDAGLRADEIGCVVAHGVSTIIDDRREAKAIHDVLGDAPVTAPKSSFGHWGAASGAGEAIVAAQIIREKVIPRTLNYEEPDPECPVNVVAKSNQPLKKPNVVVLSHSQNGQAVATIFSAP